MSKKQIPLQSDATDDLLAEIVEETSLTLSIPSGDSSVEEFRPPQSIVNVVSQRQLETLWANTPQHAIRQRPGPGGKSLSYVPHGYVEFKLNESFGGDWDFELLPAFNGSVFHIQSGEVTKKNKIIPVMYVVVLGKITVRVRDPMNPLQVVTTISKSGVGSAQWFVENELGDSVKSAASDALKRCGLLFGIALDLYYNDESARLNYVKIEEERKRLEQERLNAPPRDVPSLVMRVKQDYNLSANDLCERLYGVSFTQGVAKLSEEFKSTEPGPLWERVKSALFPTAPSEEAG